MTGLPEFNFPAFHAAAASLRGKGYTVTNPAELNPDTTMTWEQCMRRDIAELVGLDAVVCLPDWHKSRGARLEVYIASTLGMPILQLAEVPALVAGQLKGEVV
jgi:hypothetical protein